MEFTFEQVGAVGIFKFSGELTQKYEDTLKITLIRAIHGIDRAVLNFKRVTRIDVKCLQLLKRAYLTSVRLKSPLILIHLQNDYLKSVLNHTNNENVNYSSELDNEYNLTNKEAAYN